MSDPKIKVQSRRKRPVTLDDIAERAGVTKTTVSQVLSNYPKARFSDQTRKRILALAERMNYRPNFFASQVRVAHRKLIMLCVTVLDDAFAGAVASSFEGEAGCKEYNTIVSSLRGKEHVDFIANAVGSHGILQMAVVGYSSIGMLPDALLVDLAKRNTDIVTIARPSPSPLISEITYDNATAVRNLVDRVVLPGMERIWLLRGPKSGSAGDVVGQRNDIAAHYLREKGLNNKIVFISPIEAETSFLSGQRTVEKALVTQHAPDIILAFSDHHALGCIHALSDAGYEVGRDVAVTGFNDLPTSAFMRPTLTTVRVPMETMGSQAAQILMELNEGRRTEPARILLPTEFMERESGRWQKQRA